VTERYEVYGLVLETDWLLHSPLRAAPSDRSTDLSFEVTTARPVSEPWAPIRDINLSTGELYLQIGQAGNVDVLRVPRVGDAYLLRSDKIVFHLTRPEHDFHVEVVLLGVLLAYWLEHHGRVALHGAAVAQDGVAIGFLGRNGAGKTSLALAMASIGWGVCSDDLLALNLSSREVTIHPAFPQVRLWPEEAQRLLGSIDGLERAHPLYEKLRVDLSNGTAAQETTELRALYLPFRRDGADVVDFEALDGPAGLFSLMHNAFIPDLLDDPRHRPQWFQRIGDLFDRVRAFRLSYPNDIGQLPEVAKEVSIHAHSLAADSAAT
jgi:hypothetical protein